MLLESRMLGFGIQNRSSNVKDCNPVPGIFQNPGMFWMPLPGANLNLLYQAIIIMASSSLYPRSSTKILVLSPPPPTLLQRTQRITGSAFRIFFRPDWKNNNFFSTSQSWRVFKSSYIGGGSEQGFRLCFADGLNQSLVSSVAQARLLHDLLFDIIKDSYGVLKSSHYK